jgi:uncharacterized protein (DUF58 family)
VLSVLDQHLNLLELKCRRPVEHLLAGEYRSVFRGRGVEFEDVRPYQPGDDVRTMDWKVTPRTGKPHIKRYIEEREQFIYLLGDVSASMRLDDGGMKHKTVVEISALITMSAIKNQDRVGLILFSDGVEQVVPPGKGRSHALRIMDERMNFKPKGKGTDIVETLAYRHDVNAIHISCRRRNNSRQKPPDIERPVEGHPYDGGSKRRRGDRMAHLGMPRERDGLGQ